MATEGEGDVEVVATDDEESKSAEELSTQEKDETDYPALLAKEVAKNENYKQALREERQKRRKAEKGEEIEGDVEEDRIATIVRKELEPLATAFVGNKIDAALSSLTKDPEKQKLVKFFYENRIVRTGTSDDSIRADLEAALNMADGARLRKENSELRRAGENKDTIPLSGGGADRGADVAKHKYSQAQVAELTSKALRLKIDPKKFIEQTWANEKRQ